MNVPTHMLVKSQWWSAMLNNLDGLLWQSPSIRCLHICYLKLSLHFNLCIVSFKTLLDVIFGDMIFLFCYFFFLLIFLLSKYKWERYHPIIEFILPVKKKKIIEANMSLDILHKVNLLTVSGTHKHLRCECERTIFIRQSMCVHV